MKELPPGSTAPETPARGLDLVNSLSGEILYPGPPLSIQPADRDTIAYLLGRKE